MKQKTISITILLLLLIPLFPVYSKQAIGFEELQRTKRQKIQSFFDQYRDSLTTSWFKSVFRQIIRLKKSGKKTIAWSTSIKLISLARLSGRKNILADTLLFTAQIGHNASVISPMLEEAAKIYTTADNNSKAGNCFQMLGKIALNKSQYEKAATIFLSAYSCFRGINNQKASRCALSLGRISLIRNNTGPAQSYYKLALQHAGQSKSRTLQSLSEEGLGDVASRQNLHLKAQQHYEQALHIHSDNASDNRMGQLHKKIGSAFFQASKFNSSINAYQKALIRFRRANNTEMLLRTILGLVSSLRLDSKTEEAAQTFRYGLSIITRSRNAGTRGTFHRTYALFNLWRGKYSLAEKHLRKARKIFTKSKNHIGLANTFSDTAKLAVYLGRPRWRQAMLTKALRI